MIKNTKIGVIGLGYVGLPLAVELCKNFDVIAFDINKKRIEQLIEGIDVTLEVDSKKLELVDRITFTSDSYDLMSCNLFIVTVPTPILESKVPDLSPIEEATKALAKIIKKGDTIVYESTVYPGVTENFCVPILEQLSGLRLNEDFFVGYSPERINPGDKEHTLRNIKKVVSGSTPDITEYLKNVYQTVVDAGVYSASSIKIAEAAKVIENTQRDINIALINELSMIFDRLEIDTNEVLQAAGTKWNFLPFKPGLVGGHCIGVDPYYLTYRAQEVGYHPELVLAGRRTNDYMPIFVANKFAKKILRSETSRRNPKVLVLGITFKENCPDIRNTKVSDLINELQDFSFDVDVFDPHADAKEVLDHLEIEILSKIPTDASYSGIVIAVPHQEFSSWDLQKFKNLCTGEPIVFDLKAIFPKSYNFMRL